MSTVRTSWLQRALPLLTCVLIVKVTVAVVWGYRHYLPPNFSSNFLRGREAYFFDGYQWAFYPHIAAGPLTLILGLILISDRFRARYPRWHRRLGKTQIGAILLFVAPSGLWMAYYAEAGVVAAVSFAVLSCLTGLCAAMGWRAAVRRRFAVHRRWMWRCFLLLCSAVVIRVMGGLAVVSGVQAEWYDPLASWVSWTVPLAVFEVRTRFQQRIRFASSRLPEHERLIAEG